MTIFSPNLYVEKVDLPWICNTRLLGLLLLLLLLGRRRRYCVYVFRRRRSQDSNFSISVTSTTSCPRFDEVVCPESLHKVHRDVRLRTCYKNKARITRSHKISFVLLATKVIICPISFAQIRSETHSQQSPPPSLFTRKENSQIAFCCISLPHCNGK